MIPSSKAAFHSTYGDPLATTNVDVEIVSKRGSQTDGPAGVRRRSNSIRPHWRIHFSKTQNKETMTTSSFYSRSTGATQTTESGKKPVD